MKVIRPFSAIWLWPTLLACLALGCNNRIPDRPSERAADGSSNAGPDNGALAGSGEGPANVNLVEADGTVYASTLASHPGKVVLVDFWATWCPPCKKGLPKILDYERRYTDQGLAVITVSMDDAAERESVLTFLNSVNAEGDNLISKWGSSTESTDNFEIDNSLPYYKLYDRTGKLRYQFSAVPEGLEKIEPLDQLVPRLELLLKETATVQ